jgi:hypothetical protein
MVDDWPEAVPIKKIVKWESDSFASSTLWYGNLPDIIVIFEPT